MPFELRAKIGLDNSGLIAGLEQGKAAVRSFAQTAKTHIGGELSGLKSQFAAAFTVGAIAGGIRSLAQFGNDVDNLATKLNISSQEAQQFMFVAERTGSSVVQVMRGMGKEATEFLLTTKQIKEKLDEFNASGLALSPKALADLNEIASKFDDIKGGGKKLGGELLSTLYSALSGTSDAIGGTLTNIALIVEGLARLPFKGYGADAAGNKNFAKELIFQGWMGGDDEYQKEIAAQQQENLRLQKRFNDALNRRVRATNEKAFDEEDRFTANLPDALIPAELEKAKAAVHQAMNRQFDSLAKVGGFAQNTDQERNVMARELLQHVRTITATLKEIKAGNFGADGADPLL